LELQPPAVPELGEAVQQDDQRPLAGLDVMQSLVVDLGVALTNFAAPRVLAPAVPPSRPRRRCRPRLCSLPPPPGLFPKWVVRREPTTTHSPGETKCTHSRGHIDHLAWEAGRAWDCRRRRRGPEVRQERDRPMHQSRGAHHPARPHHSPEGPRQHALQRARREVEWASVRDSTTTPIVGVSSSGGHSSVPPRSKRPLPHRSLDKPHSY
jgi:hypothetical protein